MPKIYSRIFLLLLLTFAAGFAQEERSVQGALGAVTIDGKIWNQIAIRPVLPIWKFGLALDLVFYVDENGNIHKDEWDFSDGTAIKNTLIDKIYYLRFGQKSDPLYFKIGALDYVDLGYGILVNGYTNTCEYPNVRKVGLDLALKTKRFTAQGFVSDFKENIGLFGMRVTSPLVGGLPVGVSLVVDRNQYLALHDRDGDGVPDEVDDFPDRKKWQIDSDYDGLADNHPDEFDRDGDGRPDVDNIAAIHDFWDELGNDVGFDFSNEAYYDSLPDKNATLREPLINLNDDANPIGAFALDIGYPILTEGAFKLSIYAQLAKMLGQTVDPASGMEVDLGLGLIPLGISAGFGPARLNLEYRMIPNDGRFDFSYWNRSYDLERAVFATAAGQLVVRTKEQSLGRFGSQNGLFGQVRIDVSHLLAVSAQYQNLDGTMWHEADQAFVTENNQSLLGQIQLQKSISKLKVAQLFYEQRNTPNPFKFELTESTIMGYRLGLEMGGGIVLNYIFQRTFRDINGDGRIKGERETINITSIETSFAF
ncbi:MAG: hypothetical protein ABIA75_04390 [Candidatus Neomarinimicrobiota bacterium]